MDVNWDEYGAAYRAQMTAFHNMNRERQGDNTRGRVLPTRLAAAEQEWYTSLERSKELAEPIAEKLGVTMQEVAGIYLRSTATPKEVKR